MAQAIHLVGQGVDVVGAETGDADSHVEGTTQFRGDRIHDASARVDARVRGKR